MKILRHDHMKTRQTPRYITVPEAICR